MPDWKRVGIAKLGADSEWHHLGGLHWDRRRETASLRVPRGFILWLWWDEQVLCKSQELAAQGNFQVIIHWPYSNPIWVFYSQWVRSLTHHTELAGSSRSVQWEGIYSKIDITFHPCFLAWLWGSILDKVIAHSNCRMHLGNGYYRWLLQVWLLQVEIAAFRASWGNSKRRCRAWPMQPLLTEWLQLQPCRKTWSSS